MSERQLNSNLRIRPGFGSVQLCVLSMALFVLIQSCSYHTADETKMSVASQSKDAPLSETIDLALFGRIAPKGRVQDVDENPGLQEQLDVLVAHGPEAVDFLIDEIEDDRIVDHHVIDYWPEVRVGDIAFVVLTDLFTEPDGRTITMPGASWNEMLHYADGEYPAYVALNLYVQHLGRKSLADKWRWMWVPRRESYRWDPKDRCFRPWTE